MRMFVSTLRPALCALVLLAAVNAQPSSTTSEPSWTPAALSRWSWLKLGGEVRLRLEEPTAQNFLEGSDDAYDLTRIRFNIRVAATPWLRFYGEVQDIRAFAYDEPLPGSVNDRVDLRQAYIELGAQEGKGWNLRAGRQALKYGVGRLVWDPDWGSFGQTSTVPASATLPNSAGSTPSLPPSCSPKIEPSIGPTPATCFTVSTARSTPSAQPSAWSPTCY